MILGASEEFTKGDKENTLKVGAGMLAEKNRRMAHGHPEKKSKRVKELPMECQGGNRKIPRI